jgi:uncharacterized membrane protein YdbT with pleckstrin-like domain
MSYPAKLLTSGEEIVDSFRPHWRVLFVPVVVLVVGTFAAVYLLIWTDVEAVRWGLLAAAVIVAIVFVLRPFVQWLTTEYFLTTRRIIIRSGVIAKRGRDMPLSRINDARYSSSILGRLLGYGTLVVESASEHGQMVILAVPRIEFVHREIYQLSEQDDARRRGPSGTSPGDGT